MTSSSPFRTFFQHDAGACVADHSSAEHFRRNAGGLFFALGDDHALAGGQSVGLDHDRCVKVAQRCAHFIHRVANRVCRGRNVMTLEKFFGEALARLKLRCRAGRSEHWPTPAREFVDYAHCERQLGTDYGEIRLQARRQRGHGVEALQIGGQALRVIADAAISGRAIKLRNARRLPQLPHQRVLAPATAQDQNFHMQKN